MVADENEEQLERARGAVAAALDVLRETVFADDTKLTLIARVPGDLQSYIVIGDDTIDGVEEALRHARGEVPDAPPTRQTVLRRLQALRESFRILSNLQHTHTFAALADLYDELAASVGDPLWTQDLWWRRTST